MEIKKVKFKPDSLSAEYNKTEVDGTETHISSHASQWTHVPHPHLTEKVDRLKEFVCRAMGFFDGYFAADQFSPKSKADELNNLKNQMIDSFTVTGMTISGQNKNMLTLTATRKCHNGVVVGFTCPAIAMDGSTFGFEIELVEIIDQLVDEVKQYIEDGKRAQLELEFESPEMEAA